MISFNFLHGAAVILCYLATLTLAEFDANGTQNLFVYFSQSSGHDANLTNLCTSTAVDVVILGFVRDFNGTAGYPTIDFGPWACNGTRSSNETDAPGLAVCEDFGQQVKQCQDLGKKVFVSIGGQTSNTSFDAGSDGRQAAKNAARSMWDLFGEGRKSLSIRPFGSDIVVDGFDIGNISHT
jgi:chitinase